MARLIDRTVRALPTPKDRAKITWDDETKGFGVCVYPTGRRSFVLDYRCNGRQRRMVIGQYPDWSVAAARDEARKFRRAVDGGADPLSDRYSARGAPTVQDLFQRYMKEHAPSKAERSRKDDEGMWRNEILPRLGKLKVAEVRPADADKLHREITASGRPVRANRVIEVFRKSLNLAIRWGWISQNPATGVKRNQEEHRTRYLSLEEIVRLGEAMDGHPDQKAVNAIRLLLLTGARKGEVLSATWSQFDLENGTWTRPSSHTKQKREHRVPLSATTVQLLSDMKRDATGPYLFPGKNGRPMTDIQKTWEVVCQEAGLVELAGESGRKKGRRDQLTHIPTVWVHDLRRTYASLLASSGHSLQVIGALLGHSQAQTTQRYAHLFEDPLRQATETVSKLIPGDGLWSKESKPREKVGDEA